MSLLPTIAHLPRRRCQRRRPRPRRPRLGHQAPAATPRPSTGPAGALNPTIDAETIAAEIATRFTQVRDSGITEDVHSSPSASCSRPSDDEPDWLIPDLLERRDRLILTGEEGLGKSYLLRQIAIMAAAGLDPFDDLAST
jgi:hypothetical protein